MLYKNGDKYEGYFKNDKKNGEGKIIYRKRGEYEGIRKDDEILESNEMKKINDSNE